MKYIQNGFNIKIIKYKKSLYYMILISISIFLMSGCVTIDRPLPPKLLGIPFIDKDFATVTIVRKKQYSTSAFTYSLLIDGQPFVGLEDGQYTSFRISSKSHILNVIWDVPGITLLLPYGGFKDIPHRHNKKFNFQCDAGDECFITLEGKVFVTKPEDRVYINQVEKLEDDFSISDKSFVEPLIMKQK